ncbi:MAG TPA: hypothetical protein VL202_13380 [Pararhizobium sp.]|uniref:hypothetical protein n=1 Tax=Pararhizobium sp. TaxID=1977563 RepID=UPI002C449743|nr:hypothetical protein [Pararhizobium sp.]HTO32154.1 hypothetical protein [Pararhizobium sp.]
MNASRSRGAARQMDFLPPDRPARTAPAASRTRAVEIIDAEFETVTVNNRRGPYPIFNDNSRAGPRLDVRPTAVAVSQDGFFSRALSRFERRLQVASPKAFAVLVTCLCAPVFLLALGMPQPQPAVASSPALSINSVTTALNDANGMKILSVFGAVENNTDVPKAVPTILVDVIANGHRKTASRIESGVSVLAPGESRPFSTRLLHTGGKLPEVAVSFGGTGDSTP